MVSMKNHYRVSIDGTSALVSILTVAICGILLVLMLIAGVANISSLVVPLFSRLSGVVLTLFVILVLPLSVFPKTRFYMVPVSILFSFIFGITAWMFSLSTIWLSLGWWGILLLFWFRVFSSIAIGVLLLTGQWKSALLLVCLVGLKFGVRYYGIWLAKYCVAPGFSSVRDEDIEAEFTVEDEEPKQID